MLPFELSACIISLFALIYGIVSIIKNRLPMYFRILVAACGCYAMEELWVITNTVFGNYGSFVTVRLFGIFGFFCFLLSANTGGLDKITDGGGEKNRKIRFAALSAPIVLLALFSVCAVTKYGKDSVFNTVLALVVFAPIFPASYYSLKHLIIKNDDVGFLECIRGCDIICLAIYLFNCVYLIKLPEGLAVISYIADIIMALLVLLLVIFGIKGGKKWKTLL